MGQVVITDIKRGHLESVVRLLAQDALGSQREAYQFPLPKAYEEAFQRIQNDPSQELVVALDADGTVIGCLQLSFITYLTYQGGTRAQIEAVRVSHAKRGQGVGAQIIQWAINRAAEKGAHMVQLTTDKQRSEALRFYEKIGFKASHHGMKLHL